MKHTLLILAALASAPAFSQSFEGLAFERLGYELSGSGNRKARLSSAIAYFEALDRVGAGPYSTGDCLNSIYKNYVSSACSPVKHIILARSGAGTGGVD